MVTYDPAPEMLGECLDSLARSTATPQEVLVVDNSRHHETVEKLVGRALPSGLVPIFLPQTSNLGYAAAQAEKAVQRALQASPEANFDRLFALCMKSM